MLTFSTIFLEFYKQNLLVVNDTVEDCSEWEVELKVTFQISSELRLEGKGRVLGWVAPKVD